MAAVNDITGAKIQTKPSDTYAKGFAQIDWSVKDNSTELELCKSCGEINCICKETTKINNG